MASLAKILLGVAAYSLLVYFSLKLALGGDLILAIQTTGAMQPSLQPGDLLLVELVNSSKIEPGDIILLGSTPARVLAIRETGAFVLGFDNPQYKINPILVSGGINEYRRFFSPGAKVRRVVARIPLLGRLVLALKGIRTPA